MDHGEEVCVFFFNKIPKSAITSFLKIVSILTFYIGLDWVKTDNFYKYEPYLEILFYVLAHFNLVKCQIICKNTQKSLH